MAKIIDKGLMTEEEIAEMLRPDPGTVVTGRKLKVEDIYIPPQPEEDNHGE